MFPRCDVHSVCARALHVEGAHVHWYGKQPRPGRKLGHITVTAPSRALLLQRCRTIEGGGPSAEGCSAPEDDTSAAHSLGSVPVVSVVMGSDSDLPTVRDGLRVLRDFGVPFEVSIVSAHRTPERMVEFGRGAHRRGIKVRAQPPPLPSSHAHQLHRSSSQQQEEPLICQAWSLL